MAENNNKDLIRLFPDRHATSKKYMFALWDKRNTTSDYIDGPAHQSMSATFAKLAYSEFAKLTGKKIIASEIAKIFIEATQSNKEYLVILPTTVTLFNAKKFQEAIDAFIDADSDWMVAGHLGTQGNEAYILNQKTYWRNSIEDPDGLEDWPAIEVNEHFAYLYENPFIINIGKYKVHGTYEFGERSSLMTSLIKQKITRPEGGSGHPTRVEKEPDPAIEEYQFWADTYNLPVDTHGWALIDNCIQTNQLATVLPWNVKSTYNSSYWPNEDYWGLLQKSDVEMLREGIGGLLGEMISVFTPERIRGWLAQTKNMACSEDTIGACSQDQQEYLGRLHDYANMKENWGMASLKSQWTGSTDTAILGTDEFTAVSNLQELAELPNFHRIISTANGLNVCRFMDKLDFTNVKEIFWISGSNNAMDFQRQLVKEIQDRVKANTHDSFDYGTFYDTWLANNASWIGDYAYIQDTLDNSLNMTESYVNESNLAVIGDASVSHKFISFTYSPMNLAPLLKLAFKKQPVEGLENVFVDFDETFINPYYMLSCNKKQTTFAVGDEPLSTRRLDSTEELLSARFRPEIEFNDIMYYLGRMVNRKITDPSTSSWTVYLHCFWPGTYTGINKQLY